MPSTLTRASKRPRYLRQSGLSWRAGIAKTVRTLFSIQGLMNLSRIHKRIMLKLHALRCLISISVYSWLDSGSFYRYNSASFLKLAS